MTGKTPYENQSHEELETEPHTLAETQSDVLKQDVTEISTNIHTSGVQTGAVQTSVATSDSIQTTDNTQPVTATTDPTDATDSTQPAPASTGSTDDVDTTDKPAAEPTDTADASQSIETTESTQETVTTATVTAEQTEEQTSVATPDQTSSNTGPENSEQLPLLASTKQTKAAKKTSTSKRLSKPVRIILTVFVALFVLSGVASAAGYYYYETTIQKPLQTFIRPVSRGKNEPTPLPTATTSTHTTPGLSSFASIKGQSYNILLLGSDNDDKYTFPDILTQVMMIVHIDTVHNTVTMVSIPRDSWVPIPGEGSYHKIDQAFLLGAQNGNSFDNGVRLARATVEQDYGITIDNYAWVGLNGFARVIDTLGGVDINVTHPIVDDTYPNDVGTSSSSNDPYAYKRLYIEPGPQHLNGEQALSYVRSRHSDLVGDIGRTERQQQILDALKEKLNLTNIITDIPQILKDLTGSVYTDLNEQQMIAFANYGRTLPSSAITSLTLGPGNGSQNYGSETTVYDPTVGAQQDIIAPDCSTIQPTINKIFDLSNAQSCHIN
ncbi:MAG TPA: LCP family protein [Dictyobacter sp.]|jgi:LCP family protein required for cell wall assembly|nr:LCP family protein [Dictyobacter sp.]